MDKRILSDSHVKLVDLIDQPDRWSNQNQITRFKNRYQEHHEERLGVTLGDLTLDQFLSFFPTQQSFEHSTPSLGESTIRMLVCVIGVTGRNWPEGKFTDSIEAQLAQRKRK